MPRKLLSTVTARIRSAFAWFLNAAAKFCFFLSAKLAVAAHYCRPRA